MKTFKQYIKEHTIIPKESLGISRSIMPQIANADLPDFLQWVSQQGIHVHPRKAEARTLKAAQGEIDSVKVSSLLDKDNISLSKPVIVSKDEYVLDGLHRITALKQKEPNHMVNVNQVNLNIQDLIALARRYPKAFYKGLHEER